MKVLAGKVALVTGASRGVGKGVALGLGEAGATVYLTGRTVEEGKAAADLPGTIQQTAQEVIQLGGQASAIRCDQRNDHEVEAVFQRIRAEQNRLDILVNNVWGGYEYFYDGTEFWKEKGFWTVPLSRWDAAFQAGVRAYYVASVLAAPLMIAQRSGLIVNISFFAAQKDNAGVAYGVAKAASDRLAATMAYELREHQVAAVSLYPGLVRTESVLKAGPHFDLPILSRPSSSAGPWPRWRTTRASCKNLGRCWSRPPSRSNMVSLMLTVNNRVRSRSRMRNTPLKAAYENHLHRNQSLPITARPALQRLVGPSSAHQPHQYPGPRAGRRL